MQSNEQANTAGTQADELIKNLANPVQTEEANDLGVKVLDTAKPVEDKTNEQKHDWKDRFSSYKTSADKTIHSLREKVNTFDLTKKENENLKEQLSKFKELEATPNDNLSELFSEEEVDGIRSMFDSKVNTLEAHVEQLQAELGSVRTREEEGRQQEAYNYVVDSVSQSIPNFEEINNSDEFKSWINEVDNFGNVRLDLLMRAKNSVPPDIGRIVQFFKDFAVETTSQEVEQTPYTQQELLQVPSSAPTIVKEAPQGSPIVWDQATISEFYKQKALGKISPSRAKEIEATMYR